MRRKQHTKLVHEGQYVAEVEVELIETDEGWSPYLSLDDAYKLDDVRAALRRGDLKSAMRLSRVFNLTPVGGWVWAGEHGEGAAAIDAAPLSLHVRLISRSRPWAFVL